MNQNLYNSNYSVDNTQYGNQSYDGYLNTGNGYNTQGGSYGNYAMQGIQSLAALYGAYNAREMQKLAKKQFGFEVGSANRNLSNQAISYNDDLATRTRMGLALNGIQKDNPEYNRRLVQAQEGYVDGSPIRG